jgi:hypothetical protein
LTAAVLKSTPRVERDARMRAENGAAAWDVKAEANRALVPAKGEDEDR